MRCAKLTQAAPAHGPGHPLDRFPLSPPPCAKHRAKLKGTAPAHPCARGVPFIILCCANRRDAAPAHGPGHPLDRFPVSPRPCVKHCANLRGTAPAHPCARGVPFLILCCANRRDAAPAHPCARGIPFVLNIKNPTGCPVGLNVVSAWGNKPIPWLAKGCEPDC